MENGKDFIKLYVTVDSVDSSKQILNALTLEKRWKNFHSK